MVYATDIVRGTPLLCRYYIVREHASDNWAALFVEAVLSLAPDHHVERTLLSENPAQIRSLTNE